VKIRSHFEPNLPLKTPGGEKPVRQKAVSQTNKAARLKDEVKIGGMVREETSLPAPSGPATSTSAADALSPENAPRRWTMLGYYAGDCNLEEQMAINLIQMERLGVNKEIDFIAQFDRGEEPTLKLGGKPGAARYRIEEFKLHPGDLDGFTRYNPGTMSNIRAKHQKISSPELQELGPLDSADPKILKDFLNWGIKKYPAKNYLIYLYGHGAGVDGMMTDEGADSETTLLQLKSALQGALKESGVDKERVVLALESCQMGQAEVAYEFKDLAQTMLACESVQFGGGMLPEVLSREKAAGYTPETMSRELFEQDKVPHLFDDILVYGRHIGPEETIRQSTRSLIDLKAMPELQKGVKKLIRAVKTSPTPREIIQRDLEVKSRPMYYDAGPVCEYVSDLPDIAKQIINDPEIEDPKLKKAAAELKAILKKAIPQAYRQEGLEFGKNSGGLGILATSHPNVYNRSFYQGLAFDRDTGWSKFMTSYARNADPQALAAGLKEPVIKSSGLKKISRFAKGELERWPELEKEARAAKKEIGSMENDTKLSSLGKYNLGMTRAGKISSLKTIDKMAKELSPQQQEIVGSVLGELVSRFDALNLKTTLTVLAALEGEISSKTLAASARELAKSGVDRIINKAFINQVLTVLGYASRNEKVVLIHNLDTRNQAVKLAQFTRLDQGEKKLEDLW